MKKKKWHLSAEQVTRMCVCVSHRIHTTYLGRTNRSEWSPCVLCGSCPHWKLAWKHQAIVDNDKGTEKRAFCHEPGDFKQRKLLAWTADYAEHLWKSLRHLLTRQWQWQWHLRGTVVHWLSCRVGQPWQRRVCVFEREGIFQERTGFLPKRGPGSALQTSKDGNHPLYRIFLKLLHFCIHSQQRIMIACLDKDARNTGTRSGLTDNRSLLSYTKKGVNKRKRGPGEGWRGYKLLCKCDELSITSWDMRMGSMRLLFDEM